MDEKLITTLYFDWIISWNIQDASKMAALLTENCNMVGFDGSQMNGREQIYKEISNIFTHHKTPRFIGLVKEVRFLHERVALLRSNVGMIPRGQSALNPALNAVQTMIAKKDNGRWSIDVFQNTPAAFHGRPELSEGFSAELKEWGKKVGFED